MGSESPIARLGMTGAWPFEASLEAPLEAPFEAQDKRGRQARRY
jgi:hypothetical protein